MDPRTKITSLEEKLDTPEIQYRFAAQLWKLLNDELEEKAKKIADPEKTSDPTDISHINRCIDISEESINSIDQTFPYLSKAAEKDHIKATQLYMMFLLNKMAVKDFIKHMEAMKESKDPTPYLEKSKNKLTIQLFRSNREDAQTLKNLIDKPAFAEFDWMQDLLMNLNYAIGTSQDIQRANAILIKLSERYSLHKFILVEAIVKAMELNYSLPAIRQESEKSHLEPIDTLLLQCLTDTEMLRKLKCYTLNDAKKMLANITSWTQPSLPELSELLPPEITLTPERLSLQNKMKGIGDEILEENMTLRLQRLQNTIHKLEAAKKTPQLTKWGFFGGALAAAAVVVIAAVNTRTHSR